jgi:beta-N-acetylhexosaminidase
VLIIGIAGETLADIERDWLAHPAVSGVILFSRNFSSRSQLIELVADLRGAAPRPIVICVDQEGGRVQRFRDGFVALPPLAVLEATSDAEALAEQHAWLMASEVLACGVDLSFAPVVDLGRGNLAIGDRALSADPVQVSRLGLAYLRGMHAAGMAVTLKHFPGHGSVREDTHFDEAIDPRPLQALQDADLLPFRAGIAAGADAMMLAHVTYPAVDALPAGYSRRWIHDILRGELGFSGVVISDDIGMAAAESAGGVAARLQAHIDAGCDIVLVCTPALVPEAIAGMPEGIASRGETVARLAGRRWPDWLALAEDADYQRACQALRPLAAIPQEHVA